jgi:aminopeptidase N
MSMHRTILLAASALTTLLAPAALAEPGFDFDRTPGRLPKTVAPIYYRIDIVPDLQKLSLAGHETVEITVRKPTDSITLNQIGLSLNRVTLENGATATVTKDEKVQLATLHFAAPVAAGKHTLTIDYTAPIPNTPAGIYYTDYPTPSGTTKRMLVTQFEATDARRMFPGWDEPAFKARFELSAVVPANFVARSNMPAVAVTPAGTGLKKVQFAASPRMSTYLLALVAGDMADVNGKAGGADIAVWSPSGEEQQGAYALSVARNVLPYYNDYFGVHYPLPKLDLIAIPGNFEAGAMENWGAITFSDEGLLFDDKSSDAATRERIHIYVAHEMAHQWSGDLVTMAWWDNLWLNEGFATWMEYKATDHFNPSWQEWPRQHDARETAMGPDAHPTTHPIQQPVLDDSEATAAFDQISYQKGEQVIRMIEDWIGPDHFRDGMRAYMKTHQYSSATSGDLWAALSKASGRDVAAVASGFVEQPGVPLVKVARSCTGNQGQLTLTQDRFTVNDPNPKKLTWTIPVTLGEPGSQPTKVLLQTTPISVKLASCDAALKANFGEAGYYRTQYDAASLVPLVRHFAEFGAADRANLLGDQFALFQANLAPLSAYLDLLPALKGETNIAVWEDTLSHLNKLDGLTRGTPVRAALRAYTRSLLRPEFDRLGWDAKPGESFLDTSLRPDLIAALGQADDPDIKAEASRRFDAFVKDPASLAPTLRDPVVHIVGHHADQATYDRLRKLGETATSSEEKLRYFTAMAVAEDPALIGQTIQYAISGKVPNGRIVMMIGYAGHDSDNPDMVFKLVQKEQAQIRTHLAGVSQNYLLPAASFASNDPDVAKALMADPATTSSNGAKLLGAEVADNINTSAALRQRAVPALEAWLRNN